MLKIRLKRVGRKHDPTFRVVLVDSHEGPQTGKINEILGFYDAKKDIKELKTDSIKNWISQGAQVSDTVHNLLVDQKVIEGKKINVLPKKSPVVKEEKKETKPESAKEAKEASAPSETETPVAEETAKIPEISEKGTSEEEATTKEVVEEEPATEASTEEETGTLPGTLVEEKSKDEDLPADKPEAQAQA